MWKGGGEIGQKTRWYHNKYHTLSGIIVYFKPFQKLFWPQPYAYLFLHFEKQPENSDVSPTVMVKESRTQPRLLFSFLISVKIENLIKICYLPKIYRIKIQLVLDGSRWFLCTWLALTKILNKSLWYYFGKNNRIRLWLWFGQSHKRIRCDFISIASVCFMVSGWGFEVRSSKQPPLDQSRMKK